MPENKSSVRNIYNYYIDPTKAISKIKADGLSCENCPYLKEINVLGLYMNKCELFDFHINNLNRLRECLRAKPIKNEGLDDEENVAYSIPEEDIEEKLNEG